MENHEWQWKGFMNYYFTLYIHHLCSLGLHFPYIGCVHGWPTRHTVGECVEGPLLDWYKKMHAHKNGTELKCNKCALCTDTKMVAVHSIISYSNHDLVWRQSHP